MYVFIIILKVWLLIAMWDAGLAFKLYSSQIVLQMNKNTGRKGKNCYCLTTTV